MESNRKRDSCTLQVMQLVTSQVEDAGLEVAGSGKFPAISGNGIPESLPACDSK